MKGYTVFNVEQIEGLPEHYYGKPQARPEPVQRIEHAESFLDATGANIVHAGSRACYVVSTDNIHMPCIDFFRDAESYYAVRAHETVHWTRHESRLNRDFERKRFGDEGYAMEELVAELGSAFLCADLALTPEVLEDHASYIASWIKVLKNDKRAIFAAASHAQRAADFLHGFQLIWRRERKERPMLPLKKETAIGWHPDPEFWSANRAERRLVDGYELVAFDLPAASGLPAEIDWELFGGPEGSALIATGQATTFDAAKAAAEAALAAHIC
nr:MULTISPECIES: zincin-like metallopeptidase domain-containing protein [unclassified Bradyrhizobium]